MFEWIKNLGSLFCDVWNIDKKVTCPPNDFGHNFSSQKEAPEKPVSCCEGSQVNACCQTPDKKVCCQDVVDRNDFTGLSEKFMTDFDYEPTEEEISTEAYFIWVDAENHHEPTDGRDQEFWALAREAVRAKRYLKLTLGDTLTDEVVASHEPPVGSDLANPLKPRDLQEAKKLIENIGCCSVNSSCS